MADKELAMLSAEEQDRFAQALLGEADIDYSTMTRSQIIGAAAELKDQGNSEYKRGILLVKHTAGKDGMVQACKFYARALERLSHAEDPGLGPISTEDAEAAEKLSLSLYLNLAAAGVALESWDSASASATQVLSMQPGNAKALLRRSQAYVGMGKLEEALADLRAGVEAHPKNKTLRKEYRAVKAQLLRQQEADEFRRATEAGKARQRQRQQQPKKQRQQQPQLEKKAVEAAEVKAEAEAADAEAAETAAAATAEVEAEAVQSSPPLQTVAERLSSLPATAIANGGRAPAHNYVWSQTAHEAVLTVCLPLWARARDVRVTFKRSCLTVALSEAASARARDDAAAAVAAAMIARAQAKADAKAGAETDGEVDVKVGAEAGAEGEPATAATAAAAAGDGGSGGGGVSGGLDVPLYPGCGRSLVAGQLRAAVVASECDWMLAGDGWLEVTLQKESVAGGEPGHEWWEHIIEGHPGIDTALCSAGGLLADLPPSQRANVERRVYEHQALTPEEQQERNEKQRLRLQMEEEAANRRRRHAEIMRDNPQKAHMYAAMKEQFPDLPIQFR